MGQSNLIKLYFLNHTDKKENKVFLIYKEVQKGAVAKSYTTNGLLIYDEIFVHFLIRKPILLGFLTLQLLPYEENSILFLIIALEHLHGTNLHLTYFYWSSFLLPIIGK
jgi:hypothetical protein